MELKRKSKLLLSELSEVRSNLRFAFPHNLLILSIAIETQVGDKYKY